MPEKLKYETILSNNTAHEHDLQHKVNGIIVYHHKGKCSETKRNHCLNASRRYQADIRVE